MLALAHLTYKLVVALVCLGQLFGNLPTTYSSFSSRPSIQFIDQVCTYLVLNGHHVYPKPCHVRQFLLLDDSFYTTSMQLPISSWTTFEDVCVTCVCSAVNSRNVAATHVYRVLNVTITCLSPEFACAALATCSTAGLCVGEFEQDALFAFTQFLQHQALTLYLLWNSNSCNLCPTY